MDPDACELQQRLLGESPKHRFRKATLSNKVMMSI